MPVIFIYFVKFFLNRSLSLIKKGQNLELPEAEKLGIS